MAILGRAASGGLSNSVAMSEKAAARYGGEGSGHHLMARSPQTTVTAGSDRSGRV
jgi:hypothetical protein